MQTYSMYHMNQGRSNKDLMTCVHYCFCADLFQLLCVMIVLVLLRDVNETLRPETETRPRRLASSSRRDRDVQSGVRDETETETLIGRDRDIFRDLGTLSFISEVVLPCISFSPKLTKFKNSEVHRAVSV